MKCYTPSTVNDLFVTEDSSHVTAYCVCFAGGGSGIGKAVCELFAREGAQIAAVDLNEGQLHETLKSLQSEGVSKCHM